MPKASSKKRPSPDVNQIAAGIVGKATGEPPPAPEPEPITDAMREVMRKLGSIGGKKGGKARAAKLSKRRRAAIAKKAAKTRWAKEA